MKKKKNTQNDDIARTNAAIKKVQAQSLRLKKILLTPNFEKLNNSLCFLDPKTNEFDRAEFAVGLSWILKSFHNLVDLSLIDVAWLYDITQSPDHPDCEERREAFFKLMRELCDRCKAIQTFIEEALA